MSTFQVNTTLDTVAIDLRTGRDATGHVSLRSAIMAADAQGGSNTINLQNGTYTLTIAGANEDASATGDLDITSNLTIRGAGAGRTVIDGNNLDRVIQVLRGIVNISGVTIQHGLADTGGGLLNSGGQVSLSSVVVAVNRARGTDGAMGLLGTGGGQDGGTGGDGGDGTAGLGGGIFNAAGSLSIDNSTITGNQAFGGNGGQGGDGGSAQGASLPGSDGEDVFGGLGGRGGAGGAARGGGIFNAAGAILTLSGTAISLNEALAGVGGTGGFGGRAIAGAGGAASAGLATKGGSANGGFGGVGGAGGAAEGGGLYNLGSVSLLKSTNRFNVNFAFGGAGGAGGAGGEGGGGAGGSGVGTVNGNGGIGGFAFGGDGGDGGLAGDGAGGGVFNGPGGSFTSTAAVVITANQANGGQSGNGRTGGFAGAGAGGTGADAGAGGAGGDATGGNSGRSSVGGAGRGGGIFNAMGGTIVIRPLNSRTTIPASTFDANQAIGGAGGLGARAAEGDGGLGRMGGPRGSGGSGGKGVGGSGAPGSIAGAGIGGALDNAGTVVFTGVTVNIRNNQALGGAGRSGGAGGLGEGFPGGDGVLGGQGGSGIGGPGGNGGIGGDGLGGGIFNATSAKLTIDPRLGAKKGSPQSKATDTITGNQAKGGIGGAGGQGGGAFAGQGGHPNGLAGSASQGAAGADERAGAGLGGGLVRDPSPNVTINNTKITGNTASTAGNDVGEIAELF
jgi:hypothetical protein